MSEIIYPKCATMLDFLDDAIERVTKLERETDNNDVKKEIVVLKFVIEAYEAKLKYYNTPDAIVIPSGIPSTEFRFEDQGDNGMWLFCKYKEKEWAYGVSSYEEAEAYANGVKGIMVMKGENEL